MMCLLITTKLHYASLNIIYKLVKPKNDHETDNKSSTTVFCKSFYIVLAPINHKYIKH